MSLNVAMMRYPKNYYIMQTLFSLSNEVVFFKAILAFSKHKIYLPKILLLHNFVVFGNKRPKSPFLTYLPYQEIKTVFGTNMNHIILTICPSKL